jgi:hypothetical protein
VLQERLEGTLEQLVMPTEAVAAAVAAAAAAPRSTTGAAPALLGDAHLVPLWFSVVEVQALDAGYVQHMVQHKQHHIQQQQQEHTIPCCFAERGCSERCSNSTSNSTT